MSNPPPMPSRRQRSPVKAKADERVSDDERQAVVEQLRLNTADGRLDMDEFGDRVEIALVARTGSELCAVLSDLPHVDSPLIAAERRRTQVKAILIPYVLVNTFLVLIWALTDFGGYFWPVWPILGWGIGVVMAIAKVAGDSGRPGWRE